MAGNKVAYDLHRNKINSVLLSVAYYGRSTIRNRNFFMTPTVCLWGVLASHARSLCSVLKT